MSGLLIANFIKEIETYTNTRKPDQNNETQAEGNMVSQNENADAVNETIIIKDLFNFFASTSISNFINIDLTMPSPEDKERPQYNSKDILMILNMKGDELSLFYNHKPDVTIFFISWVLFWSFISFHYGKLYFNNENFDKAYEVVGELIKRDIRKAEYGQKENNEESDQSSFYQDIKRFKHKWSKVDQYKKQ